MIEAGAAGVHFEDQLSSEKKCGHLGGACVEILGGRRINKKVCPACLRLGSAWLSYCLDKGPQGFLSGDLRQGVGRCTAQPRAWPGPSDLVLLLIQTKLHTHRELPDHLGRNDAVQERC